MDLLTLLIGGGLLAFIQWAGDKVLDALGKKNKTMKAIEGLSERFNPKYWDYAKLISGVLRYRMPIDHVIRLITSLQLENDTMNSWTAGVARVLKKYLPDAQQALEEEEE